MSKLSVFEVDKTGLSKLVARRGKEFIIGELIQNAWDENVTRVDVRLSEPKNGRVTIEVEDDSPDGFADISHAYTLFAESKKKSDPTKRGRFNLGEKLVIALCEQTIISTTTGKVVIENDGRTMLPAERKAGSVFIGTLKMTRAEYDTCVSFIETLLVPSNIVTTFNGAVLESRQPLRSFEETLATEHSDDKGYLRPTRRKTIVEVYAVKSGETASIYEMGIPVVETEDTWHINIMQKVPLNSDRDNVKPSFLRETRVAVANQMADLLTADDVASSWVNEAMNDERISADAAQAIITQRFGDKAVVYDPSDPEANKIAMAQGYTVIPGRTFSSFAWDNIRSKTTLSPAGRITPSPQAYFSGDGPPRPNYPADRFTAGMHAVIALSKEIAQQLYGIHITVALINSLEVPAVATFGGSMMEFNVARLGRAWFDNPCDEQVLSIIIHELAHHRVSDHLSSAYYNELSDLGARLALKAAADPSLLDPNRWLEKVAGLVGV